MKLSSRIRWYLEYIKRNPLVCVGHIADELETCLQIAEEMEVEIEKLKKKIEELEADKNN